MTDQTSSSGVEGERGITPVSGPVEGSGRALARRGIGAAALIAFSVLVIWSTWKSEKPVEQDGAKPIIRQTTTFEPAREPPAPAPVQEAALPVLPPQLAPAAAPQTDKLMESARRAPVLAFNRPSRGSSSDGAGQGAALPGSALLASSAEPRNELADKLKATTIEGVRAARLPNRNLLVTQGTAIPCVLETAMSSDVPGFVSCVVLRDVLSDSGHVVLMEKGTQIVGEYRGQVRKGSKRMFVLWTRAKTPTGVIVALASPATDALGRAGFDGKIDTHFWERFGAALLLSIVSDAAAIGRQQLDDADIEIRNTSGAANTAAGIAVERSIDIPPTLNKNQGERVNIFVARDLDFSSVYDLKRIESRARILDRTVHGIDAGVAAGSRVTKP
ncbi:Type IV secretion system protein virB10 [Bosea sp. 62]|uniref:type IV secretion system protein VirB10 n=1 Tax=unclassified Bosea (in: a-proteobacteria) TaxID=2653178 RepID=UPI001258ADE6|nr:MULTISPECIES: type IV secretion system protein VirB10 [unclassified Bosea (in: a-proteobacteria)]CAD5291998.1 Type IV secretion system protein virB10 [Bosea sp. 21B]CAD5293029.1 Type IV secretion system protein virB10 [Bosea sp. 46]CAD5299883.1 Type IV secretion system protein virB10 [Bosea sp. 7B]VVT57063.1 Type IV secretion system protein virB10 [Bosea sp. EC-HK365B]VXB48003.1 Type IV secretion system protein virB10 [Bosea sp. 127]